MLFAQPCSDDVLSFAIFATGQSMLQGLWLHLAGHGWWRGLGRCRVGVFDIRFPGNFKQMIGHASCRHFWSAFIRVGTMGQLLRFCKGLRDALQLQVNC